MDKLGQIEELGFGKYILKNPTWVDFRKSLGVKWLCPSQISEIGAERREIGVRKLNSND